MRPGLGVFQEVFHDARRELPERLEEFLCSGSWDLQVSADPLKLFCTQARMPILDTRQVSDRDLASTGKVLEGVPGPCAVVPQLFSYVLLGPYIHFD